MTTLKLITYTGLTWLLFVGLAEAQNVTYVLDGVLVSHSLAGHVDIGSQNVVGNGVTVELCSSGWKAVLASTKTDDHGYFEFIKKPSGRIFYLQFWEPGVNRLQVKVRVSKRATHDLTIHLNVAT